MTDMIHRNKNIYSDYISGKLSIEEMCKKYNLSASTIKTIISRYNKLSEERITFVTNVFVYAKIHYPKCAIKIYHNFYEHLKVYEIYGIDNITNLINSDEPIKGIGKGYRNILREYLGYRI